MLRDAAADILDKGISLKAIARSLRTATGDDYVPTVTGTAWTGTTLRDVLTKPATAGLVARNGELVEAPWPGILPRERWEKLVALFESQKTGTSNEPRWLVSGTATCGICQDGTTMRVTGSADRRAYVCSRHGHLRRDASRVDDYVSARVIKLLERDAPGLLVPAPKVTADTGKLRAEAGRLTAKRDDLARLYNEEVLTEAGVRQERKRIDARLAAIAAELAASDQADPLPEFRSADVDAAAVWASLGLARQRAIVRLLYDIEIQPGQRGGRMSDEVFAGTVKMTRKSG